ncbi:hypothetical protein HK097_011198 [Rhizophlyctis rosea]|uniref:Uncharacterized protein n=1 Tax=Rhizophlyctis rosea TaxID=64517 RepID=A0AAD5X9B4_9FUNG|nr:hypothetical protein HK097_011198 [Rhizophlyctis rosea]
MVMKEMMAFDQAYHTQFPLVEATGVFDLPDPDVDPVEEANRRVQAIRSFYDPEKDGVDRNYWLSSLVMQSLRAGLMTGAWADVKLNAPNPEDSPSKPKLKKKRKHSNEPDSEEDGGAYHPRKSASQRKRKRRNWGRPTSEDSSSEEEEDEIDEDDDDTAPATEVLVSRKGKAKQIVDMSSVMAELHELRKVAAAAEKAVAPAKPSAPPQYELVIEEQRIYEGESISHVFWSTTEVSPVATPPIPFTPSGPSLSPVSTPAPVQRNPEGEMGTATHCLNGERIPASETARSQMEFSPAVPKKEEEVSPDCVMAEMGTEKVEPELDDSNVGAALEEPPGRSQEITLNVFSRSGKTVAREMLVSARYTFAELIKLLPLPPLGDDKQYVCFAYKDTVPTSSQQNNETYLPLDRLSKYLADGDAVGIRTALRPTLDEQDF